MRSFNLSLILLAILCYSNVISEEECGYDKDGKKITPKSGDDCKNTLTNNPAYKCCYEYYEKKKDDGRCEDISLGVYKHLVQYMKLMEDIAKDEYVSDSSNKDKGEDYGKLHIDCKSYFYDLGILSLLFALL